MVDELSERGIELATAEYQNPIQAFAPDCAHETLSEGICPWSPDRGSDDPDALGPKEAVEAGDELAFMVANRYPAGTRRSAKVHGSWRTCSVTEVPVGWAVTPASCTRRVSSSMRKSTYSRRRGTVSTVKKSQANMVEAWLRTNSFQLGPRRFDEGSMSWRFRIATTARASRIWSRS